VSNRLIDQSSPYLLQHAENPVDWYPWGEEALTRAREEDKPIFLSIGYAACHWCHVMAHESFEDDRTAALLNEYFINIKVDREERPDIDGIYMKATVGMTGQGGWPMSVWLTPDGAPFYAGTYFPPTRRHGMPSFGDVINSLADAWRGRRDQIATTTERVMAAMRDVSAAAGGEGIDPTTIDESAIVGQLARLFDGTNGGWGDAPKFPQPMALEFLVRHVDDTGDPRPLMLVEKSLTSMADGGIYDLLGGGFHRYATDARWLVPHFEKMLYDNAQLARVYLHAWQVTGSNLFRDVVREILDYVLREMHDPRGGFYSSQDADSEGVEGKFFVWSYAELQELLRDDTALAAKAWDASSGGNWEGKNILHRVTNQATLSAELGVDPEEMAKHLDSIRQRLWHVREKRVKPGLDDKVLTSWNGLMLAAFAEAGSALGEERYLEAARSNASFLLDTMRTEDGRLRRVWTERQGSNLNGYLEDYSYLIEGLLALYQATFEYRWFAAARDLADIMIERFRADDGGFFDTSDDHETLITRPRDLQDNAVPSGNAMASTVLLKLAALTGESRYEDEARAAFDQIAGSLQQHPLAFGQWLVAYDLLAGGRREVAIVGDPLAQETQVLLDVVRGTFRPNAVVALQDPVSPSDVPLLEGRTAIDGRPTAYVCEGFVCRQPVTEADELRVQLDGS
jgi:uncharacterized protein YyaL (SSP411 family)